MANADYGLGLDNGYYTEAGINQAHGVANAQIGGALLPYANKVVAYPDADSLLVAEGTGKQVTIEPGMGVALHNTYGPVAVRAFTQATCSTMTDGSAFPDSGTIYIYAVIEASAAPGNDTRTSNIPLWRASLATSLNGGLKLASVVLSGGAITTVTDLRDVVSYTDLNIHGLTAETAPVDSDTAPFYDVSATANRKVTFANLWALLLGAARTVSALWTFRLTTSTTNAAETTQVLDARCSGTPADGFGAAQIWQAQTSTTNSQQAGRIRVFWSTVTHASRIAKMIFSVHDSTAERDAIVIMSDGTEAKVGFGGVTEPHTHVHSKQFAGEFTDVNTDTTLGPHHFVRGDTSGGNVTITLPEANYRKGRWYYIQKGHASNTLTIARPSGQTINGAAANLTLTGIRTAYLVVSDGAGNWEALWLQSTAPAGGGGSLSDGDYGDISVGGSGTTLTIDNDAVTYAKMQNVSATSRVLGRKTSGAGDVEELTASEVLKMLGSTQGQILYYNGTDWVTLDPGTDGQVFTTGGAGANPAWEDAAAGGSGIAEDQAILAVQIYS